MNSNGLQKGMKRYAYVASFEIPREDGTAHRVDARVIVDASNERDASASLRRIVAAHFPATSAADWQRKI